jgi:hypothetical protein
LIEIEPVLASDRHLTTGTRKLAIRVCGRAHKENVRPGGGLTFSLWTPGPFCMARLWPSAADFISVLKETALTRNHLLILSLKRRGRAQAGVWRMTLRGPVQPPEAPRGTRA